MKEAANPNEGKAASKNTLTANNIQSQAVICYSEALQDGRNMATLYRNLKGGLSTYYKLFSALEAKYEPFYNSALWEAFIEHISQHPDYIALKKEVFRGMQ